ncbi:uncharacterized protein C2orf78-like [Equus asinus]|uniref:uncharacterized protein C2orf78-like n=1 Tax=Equus asinus TaxID=9793 RepID=UPI0038F8127E
MPLMYKSAGWQEACVAQGARATQTSSGIVSSSLGSAVDASSSFLAMSENFQNPSLLGTPNSLQLSLPVVSDAASLAGSVCNFSRVSAPAVSSGWLLPSASGTSSQPLMGSAYLYQHSSTTMLSGVTGQSQSSTSAASYPGLFEWGVPGSTAQESSSLGDCTLTVTGHDTTVSSMSMAAHYDRTSGANNLVPLYPSLSTSLVQGTPSQVPNQGHSLSLPYQEGSQVYYYGHGTLGPLLSGELGPCLQSYGSVSYTGAGASAPQPEMVLVLKEIQPTHVLPPASTSGVYYAASAPAIPQTRSQVVETSLGRETFLGLQPPSQTFCLQQTPEFPKSCSSRNTQMLQSNPPHEPADISLTASLQTSNSNLLALSPAPKNWDEFNTNLSKPLDPDQIPIQNQDPLLQPLEIPDILQLLACIDPLGPEDHPASENADLGKSSLSLEGQGTLENGTEARGGFADIATLMEDGHLPQLFDPLKDLDQPQGPELIQAKETGAIESIQLQEKSSGRKAASDNTRKNKHQASEPLDGAPKAKIQPKDPECLSGGEGLICNAAASDRAPENEAEHSNSKPQKAAPSRISTTKSHGQERTKKTRGNNPKKAGESRQSGTEVRVEEKPMMPRMKRRKNQPELSQETFKRPRTSLGQHMLESVQVFHALGRKSEKNTGPSSSRALGTSSNPKHPQPCPAIKPWLDKPLEGQCPEETQVKAQKAESSAEMECPPPSRDELPPPGKVRLVPLPFLSVDKPPARPVPRRPQALASHRPAVADPARPASTNSAQPTAVNSTHPAPASLTGPARPARPITTNPTRPGWTNPTRPSGPQCPASRPAPYRTASCTSLQQEPVATAVPMLQAPPKPPAQYLLEDFSKQPIPWRKPVIPGPVMSEPITQEQRPEREAMKRQAQQEREKAAKYTSWGKVQFFIEREKEMEISRYYGYAI